MSLSFDISVFMEELKENPQNYCIKEVVDELNKIYGEVCNLEDELDTTLEIKEDLEERLGQYEEDKNPFNLIEFLKENLTPKEFEKCIENHYIYFNTSSNLFDFGYNTDYQNMTVYFKNIKNINKVIDTLNQNQITPDQLKQAYKELGWI